MVNPTYALIWQLPTIPLSEDVRRLALRRIERSNESEVLSQTPNSNDSAGAATTPVTTASHFSQLQNPFTSVSTVSQSSNSFRPSSVISLDETTTVKTVTSRTIIIDDDDAPSSSQGKAAQVSQTTTTLQEVIATKTATTLTTETTTEMSTASEAFATGYRMGGAGASGADSSTMDEKDRDQSTSTLLPPSYNRSSRDRNDNIEETEMDLPDIVDDAPDSDEDLLGD